MKKLFSIALALVMLLACASALAEEPITLTYSEVNPLDGTIVGSMLTMDRAVRNFVQYSGLPLWRR